LATARPEEKTMPLTKFDTVATLIVIDLQKGIVGLPSAHPSSEVVGRAARLARTFRQRGLPVVLVNVTGRAPGRTDAGSPTFSFLGDWTELVPELQQHPNDHLVSKQRLGAFIGTSLHDCVSAR
jgi:nicotinamidase-related amidase